MQDATLTKKELLERDLDLLSDVLSNRIHEYSMPLRASTSATIFEGQSLSLPVGFKYSMLNEYEKTVQLLDILKSNTWLRIAPYLTARGGISNLEIQNLSTQIEKRNRDLTSAIMSSKPTILTLDEIEKLDYRVPAAYKIQTGDEVGTLTITRKK